MIFGLKRQARHLAGQSLRGLIGAVLLAVGLGFFTAAGWLVLEAQQGALMATLIIGAAYSGLGLVFLATVAMRGAPASEHRRPEPESVAALAPAIAEAFAAGLAAGTAARRR